MCQGQRARVEVRCAADAARQQGQVWRPDRHRGGEAGAATGKPEVPPLPTVPREGFRAVLGQPGGLHLPARPPLPRRRGCLDPPFTHHAVCSSRHRGGVYLWPIHSCPITQHSFPHSLRFNPSARLSPRLPAHVCHPSGLSLINHLGVFYLLAAAHSAYGPRFLSLLLAHSFSSITHHALGASLKISAS